MKQILLAAMAALVITGCYTVQVPVTNVPANTNTMEVKMKLHHFVAGGLSFEPYQEEKIKRAIFAAANGKQFEITAVRYEIKVLDSLIGLLTSSIYTPATLVITGYLE